MPMTTAGARTFLNALSDFWALFFRDKGLIEATAEGQALNAAQLYQQFLEAVLGSSLADCPLFERTFHRPYSLREDMIVFREGASPDEDTFDAPTGDGLTDAEYLTNRVLAPTAFLTVGREFFVEPGRLRFRVSPFDADGGGASLPFFPVRTVRVVAPAAWVSPLADWSVVRPGDAAKLSVGGAVVESTVTGASGPSLFLAGAPTLLQQSLQRRSPRLDVLRTPYDAVQAGVRLSDHPQSADRLSAEASDGTSVSAVEVSVSANPRYAGAWVTLTPYAQGALADQAGSLRKARAAHTSGASFDPDLWDDYAVGYAFLGSEADPRVEGVFRLTAPTAPGRVRFAGGASMTPGTAVTLTRMTVGSTDVQPRVKAPHTQIDGATFTLYGRRVTARHVAGDGGAVTYEAGGSLLRGVDYLLNEDDGSVVILSAWDPLIPARAGYSWRLLVTRSEFPWRGAIQNGASYARGDVVVSSGVPYVVRAPHTSTGSVDANYAQFAEPARLNVERDVREIAVWATDALVDTARLYRNFGALLDRPRQTSESYRAFLRAVSRLFLLGPTFDNFESALNAVAGLPLVREDGERLVSYDPGVQSGGGPTARLYGTAQGRDGAFHVGTGRFSSETAPFLADDEGQILRVRTPTGVLSYAITTVHSATDVSVDPAPGADAAQLIWDFEHAILRQRMRVTGASFDQDSVGKYILLSGAEDQRNNGLFKILSVDDSATLELDAPYGLVDEIDVTWAKAKDGVQTVQTDRHRYVVPISVPIRADVAAGGSVVFRAFEPLTTAFRVVDYLEDPLWWTRVTLPSTVFEGEPAQRTVTPQIIEHVYGALDDARQGDPGLRYGQDEDGDPGQARAGAATWYGDDSVVLDYDAGTPGPTPRDVGRYLVVRTKKFRGQYEILSLGTDGVTLKLGRFPPPEADGLNAPVRLDVDLGPILLRRTVAFVIMNSALKYHAIQVQVDPGVGLSSELLDDALRVIQASRPSHVFVFFEALTSFRDEADWEDEVEMEIDHHLLEALSMPDSSTEFGSPLRYGDAFRFTMTAETYVPTLGVPHALPLALPGGTSPERTLVKVAFDPASRVGGVRRPAEGVDYDVDYAACTVTVRLGVALTPSPVTVRYLSCVRRILAPTDPHDPGETSIVYGGADPTLVRDGGPDASGFLDRAVQITLGP